MARKKKKAGGRSARQDEAAAVRKAIEAELAQLLRNRLNEYRQQRATLTARVNSEPILPLRERIANSAKLLMAVLKLGEMWTEVLPYIRKIKSVIPDVLDHTRLVACYLLFGKISQSVSVLLMLLKEGFHYEAMEIYRSNQEALDLILFFLQEPANSTLIQEWFAGEIVTNAVAREALGKYVEPTVQQNDVMLPVSGLKSGIYGVFSKYSHVSYAALLELYDGYSDDFDYERIAGHQFAFSSSLPAVRSQMHFVIVALKAFYKTIADDTSFRELDTLLRKYAPDYYDHVGRKQRQAELVARFGPK